MRCGLKIAVIGCGFVGSTTAYTLLLEGLASELVLINRDKDEVMGHALDLKEGMEFMESSKVIFGSDYKLAKECDIIVITAGAHQEKKETRLDLISKNAKIFKNIIPKITQYNKKAIMIIVTNPVDIMTYLALKYSKYPKERVFGTGTSLDTARLRCFLGNEINISPLNIHAYVLGEHGDSSFPVWSNASISGTNIKHFDKVNKKVLDKGFSKTKNAAYEVISKKGATYYAIALDICNIIKAIDHNSNRILPVSTMLNNYHGLSGVCLSVPCIINSKGIDGVIKIELDSTENEMLKRSYNVIKTALKNL